jgi:hypothetical protein
MSTVLLTISYTIKPEKRQEYLSLAKEMKDHFTQVRKKEYMIFEGKVKKNQFTEIFTSHSIDEFEGLDDNLDERSETLVNRLEELVDEDGIKYNTIVELP